MKIAQKLSIIIGVILWISLAYPTESYGAMNEESIVAICAVANYDHFRSIYASSFSEKQRSDLFSDWEKSNARAEDMGAFLFYYCVRHSDFQKEFLDAVNAKKSKDPNFYKNGTTYRFHHGAANMAVSVEMMIEDLKKGIDSLPEIPQETKNECKRILGQCDRVKIQRLISK